MKILFVNEYAYPIVISGAEFSMQALADKLASKKYQIFILSPKLYSGKRIKSFNKTNLLNFWFPIKTKPYKTLTPFWFTNPLFWLYSGIMIIKVIIKEKIDLIHVHGKYMLPGAIIAKFFTKKPVIVTVRDYKFLCPLNLCLIQKGRVCNWNYYLTREIIFYLAKYERNKNLLAKFLLFPWLIFGKLWQHLLFMFLKMSDKVICVSHALKKIYQQNGIANDKLLTIFNLPPDAVKKLKQRKEKIILSVGKLSYGKGTDILIEAFSLVKKQIKGVKLILVGNKNPSLEKLPNFVEHHSQINHDKIKQYYQKANVFVLASRWPEPLSRATLEALSAGLPLVVSQKGGNKEVVINGANGYLVQNNPQAFAKAIIKILNNQKRQIKMGEQSLLLLVSRFNQQKIINQHLTLYKKFTHEK